MTWFVLVGWIALVVRVSVVFRPAPVVAERLRDAAPRHSPTPTAPAPPATVTAPGVASSPQRSSVLAGVVVLVAVAAWSVPASLVLGGAGASVVWARSRRTGRRWAAHVDHQLVLLVQLLDLAVGAGATLRLALVAAAPRIGGEVGRAAERAARRLEHGQGLADALAALSADLDGRDRGILVRVADADALGAPVGAVLGRAGRDLAEAERHRAAVRARRLPVLLLLPLVACVLPAFVVLAIVPMVASGAGSLFPS